MIEEEVYDAATKGDAAKFEQLLQQDPYLVYMVSFPCSRNLLHVATLLGQVAIVEVVLERNPRLVRIPDSQKSSPLHLAVEEGKLEIASKLLSAAPEMSWSRNDQGLNPVHVAAMRGHVEMLELLLQKCPLSAMERVQRGQTVLHLCVKHGELGALKLLVEKLDGLVYATDDDGDTLLHLAVRTKQVKIIKCLAERDEVKKLSLSTNAMGRTAVKILVEESRDEWMPKELKSMISPSKSYPYLLETVSEKREQTMVVMTLIATMAFQAIVSPPGGVWQEDTPSYGAGEAVMAHTHPKIYTPFIGANITAFISSLITIFLVFSPWKLGNKFVVVFSSYAVWISLASIAVSFAGSILVIAPDTRARSLTKIINIVIIVSASFFGLTVLLHKIRALWGMEQVVEATERMNRTDILKSQLIEVIEGELISSRHPLLQKCRCK
ncbi:ankyrin repeat-containing protein-like protein [Salvia divinorum]|uniref:Ankyrin repeat-containing protein-like protein n=1 Tax=Salvia divinorum TaxID=28513 RepID=A0ABD1HPS6_SALDI